MPWSQTPVVTSTLAIACQALLPSSFLRLSAFTSDTAGSYHQTTTVDVSGLNTEPAFLIRLASDSRYRAYPQTSLLTCRLGFGQVGLAAIAATHPLVGNNQFLSRWGLPRLWIYLGTIRVEAPVTRRSPHRSGREDFPHPVPQNTQALRLCITKQVLLRLAHNIAARLLSQFLKCR